MSLAQRLESLRKRVRPGSEWRRCAFPERKVLVLEIAVCAKEVVPLIVFRYEPVYNFVWSCEPKEFFKHYERVENE